MENEFNNQIVRCLWRESARQMEFDFTMKQSFCSALHRSWDLEKREGTGLFTMQYWFDQVFFSNHLIASTFRENIVISVKWPSSKTRTFQTWSECFFSQSQAIKTNQFSMLISTLHLCIYSYKNIYIYRLSQKITPIKCLKNKLMLYFRANWTTDLDHLAPHKNILDQLGRFGPLRTSCCCSKLVINCQMDLFLKISGRVIFWDTLKKKCTYTNVNTITNTDETNSK